MAVFDVTYLRENHIMEPSLMDTINYYDNLIQESFNEFDHQMYILSEADEMGVDGAKQSLIERFKGWIKGIIEKVKDLWKKFKAKIAELKGKIFKKENKSDDKEKDNSQKMIGKKEDSDQPSKDIEKDKEKPTEDKKNNQLLLADKSSLAKKAYEDLKELKFYNLSKGNLSNIQNTEFIDKSEDEIMQTFEDHRGICLQVAIDTVLGIKDIGHDFNRVMSNTNDADSIYNECISELEEIVNEKIEYNNGEKDLTSFIEKRKGTAKRYYTAFMACTRMAATNAESYAKVKAYFRNIAR